VAGRQTAFRQRARRRLRSLPLLAFAQTLWGSEMRFGVSCGKLRSDVVLMGDSADHAMDGSPVPYCGGVDASSSCQTFRPNPQVVAGVGGATDDSPEVTCGSRP
jgi:hypothetical protein